MEMKNICGKAGPRVPGPGDNQQRTGYGHGSVEKRFEVTGMTDQHICQRSQHENCQNEKYQHSIKQVEGLTGFALGRAGRKNHQYRQKTEFEGGQVGLESDAHVRGVAAPVKDGQVMFTSEGWQQFVLIEIPKADHADQH